MIKGSHSFGSLERKRIIAGMSGRVNCSPHQLGSKEEEEEEKTRVP
jgi:hypothetical protein